MNLFDFDLLNTDIRNAMPQFQGFTDSFIIAMMAASWFPLHIEESDQPSINLVHVPNREKIDIPKAIKVWIIIPPNQSHHVERLLDLLIPEDEKWCSNFLAHRNIMINPQILTQFGIDYYIGSANEGEITVLLPRAYHTGMVNIVVYIMYFTAMEVYV